MPAPDLATLYDFETHFLTAGDRILSAVGFNVFTALEARDLVTPRLELFFVMQPEDDALSQTPGTGAFYYNAQNARFDINLVTRQSDPIGLSHGTFRGKLRVEMLRLRGRWVAPTLPYYQVWKLSSEASKPEVYGDNDEIISRLSYAVAFRIPPEAFPADA